MVDLEFDLITDMDYVKGYIEDKKYIPKTSKENLAHMIIAYYDGELQENETEYYGIKDYREYPKNLMINIEDVDCYVNDMGGLEEFDYYC